MLTFLRRQAFLRGIIAGHRAWTTLWVGLFGMHLLRRLTRPDPKVVFSEPLRPGQSLVIRHEEPAPRRR